MIRAEQLAALHGLIAPEVGLRLAELAKEVPRERAIVEIGAYHGKSSCYLAEGARVGHGAHVWSVDAWDLAGNVSGKHGYAEPDAFALWLRQVESMGLEGRITSVRAFSLDAARDWGATDRVLEAGTIGLLFIDASHFYRDVKNDYEAWTPFLGDGGVIAFDDYGTRRNPGVTEFVRELVAHDANIVDWDFHTQPLAIARRMLP